MRNTLVTVLGVEDDGFNAQLTEKRLLIVQADSEIDAMLPKDEHFPEVLPERVPQQLARCSQQP